MSGFYPISISEKSLEVANISELKSEELLTRTDKYKEEVAKMIADDTFKIISDMIRCSENSNQYNSSYRATIDFLSEYRRSVIINTKSPQKKYYQYIITNIFPTTKPEECIFVYYYDIATGYHSSIIVHLRMATQNSNDNCLKDIYITSLEQYKTVYAPAMANNTDSCIIDTIGSYLNISNYDYISMNLKVKRFDNTADQAIMEMNRLIRVMK